MQEDLKNKDIHPEVKKYFSSISGGKVKSEKKAIAVRKNGCAPCGPGKFRGRPKKVKE